MELFDNAQMFLFEVDINLNMQPLQNFGKEAKGISIQSSFFTEL